MSWVHGNFVRQLLKVKSIYRVVEYNRMSLATRSIAVLARACQRARRTPIVRGEVTQGAIDNAPTVTMFLRKDHYLFAGQDGQRRLRGLKESYAYSEAKGNSARVSIPFYLPHSIGLQDFKLSSSSGFIPGDVYAQSCFALFINDRPCQEHEEKLGIFTVSDAFRPNVVSDDNSSCYRCLTESHVRNGNLGEPERTETCSFIPGYNGMRIPERTMVDELFLADLNREGDIEALPFKFSVAIASDSELEIDDEWSMIKDWARRKA